MSVLIFEFRTERIGLRIVVDGSQHYNYIYCSVVPCFAAITIGIVATTAAAAVSIKCMYENLF